MEYLDCLMMENQLSHSKVKIEFIKLDGSYRIMICTQSPEFISESNLPTGKRNGTGNDKILRVFDLNKNEWRSIRKDRITQWELA